ncbi:MAG: secretin N-terminal domain-containing protein [Deltaproteobacteria bacterium]|nr:secretin N-terminal domain-containing protein [Deltaproteobacteria bacterium]
MRQRFLRTWLKGVLGIFLVVGCATVNQEPGRNVSAPPPDLQASVESAAAPAPPAPAPPALLLPLKHPDGAPELETLVALTVTNGSLKQVLQALAEQAGVNLIIDRDIVDESVTINIKNLPLWGALDALLTSHNLHYSIQPAYIRISRMMTRIFHVDYIRSLRAGTSNTQVSLSSGGSTGESTGAAAGGGTSTSLGALGGGSSLGDITIQSYELVDFWTDFENDLRQIMRDPLYEILRTEYDQMNLKRDLSMLPYEEEYEREVIKHRLEMFRLQREMAKKRLETGVAESAASIPEAVSAPASAISNGGEEDREAEGGGQEEDKLVGTYSIDPQTGTLVVTTTPEVMARIESFLSQVRQNLTRQVHIDVQILEVSLSEDKKMGVDWGGFPGMIQYYRMPHLRDLIESQMLEQAEAGGGGGGGTTGGQGITSPLSTSPFATSPEGSLQLGVLSTIGSHRALQYSLNPVISFLKEHGEVKAVSRPQITTLNNQPAVVSVGVNDFYATFEQQTTSAEGGLATSSVTSRLNPIFIGVTLHITPQISPEGEIAMKIVPAINKMIGEKTVPTGIPSAPTQTIPLLETRQTSTIVKTQSGQTIIISGLIQENGDVTEKKVPFFSDLPGLGNLFHHTVRHNGRSELVMLLTPRLADTTYALEQAGYEKLSGSK